jgi:hypothetical protein
MADSSESAARTDVLSLAARIRDLEATFIRTPLLKADAGDTNACTNCNTHCSHCRGDNFIDVLLPGEELALSGSELVNRVRASRTLTK